MNRCISILLTLAACQDVQQPATEQVQQDVVACAGNFADATLASMPYFNGKAPLATSTQIWVIDRNTTELVAYLTDFVACESVYGTRVSIDDTTLLQFLSDHHQAMTIRGPNPPPPPPPCPGC